MTWTFRHPFKTYARQLLEAMVPGDTFPSLTLDNKNRGFVGPGEKHYLGAPPQTSILLSGTLKAWKLILFCLEKWSGKSKKTKQISSVELEGPQTVGEGVSFAQ
jgi:hypothetical protein